jgi:hypothetical protein
MKLLHKIIFWTHLLAGVIAGLVIFIMSFTGVVLCTSPDLRILGTECAGAHRWGDCRHGGGSGRL